MATQGLTIPITIKGYNEAKAQLDALNTSIINNNDATEEQIVTHKELKKVLDATDESIKSAAKANKDFTDGLVYSEEGMLEVSASISKLEDQMYALAIAGESGSEEFTKLQKKTAELKTVIIETDRQIDTLAENKGFGQVGAGLGSVGERLISLDFAGAGKEAQMLNNNMVNLGQMGGDALKGLGKTVTNLSKAFVKMGVALLANPIFLIAAAIIGIVTAIGLILNKLGILQPVLDAIGAVFEWIGSVIDSVVQGFNDFTDALGFTTNAADEFANSQIDNAQRVQASNENLLNNIVDGLDHEIRMRQINGEETVDLEIEKQEAIKQSTEIAIAALMQEMAARVALGDLTKEEIEKYQERGKVLKQTIKDSNQEIEAIQATADKASSEKFKAFNSERLAEEKQSAADRLAVARQMEDLRFELMEEGFDKEQDLNYTNYQRKIEDTLTNETLLQTEKEALIQSFEAIREQNANDIEQKFNDKKKADLDKLKADADLALEEQQSKDLEAYNKKVSDDEAETARLKIEDEKRAANRKAAFQAGMDATTKGLEAVGQLSDMFFDNQTKGLEKGSVEEQKAAKKKFEINKKLQIALAVVQGVQAVLAAYSSGSAIPIVGAVTGPLFAALAAVSTISNIGKIKNSQFEGANATPNTGGGGGNPAASVQAATPSFNLFGNNNDLNNVEGSESSEAAPITVNAVVSETEVTSTQNRVENIQRNAEL